MNDANSSLQVTSAESNELSQPIDALQSRNQDRSSSAAWKHWFLAALLAACTWNVYLNAFEGVFLFDDLTNIVNNRALRGSWLDAARSSRPLTMLTFAYNYRTAGLSASHFHLFNNAIHAMAAVLMFFWLRETLRQHDLRIEAPQAAAFCASLLWAVHPLNTQAVTYIVQRAESLMGMFFFAFMMCVAKSASSRRFAKWLWLLTACASLVLGLASKQVMLMALPVGLLYDRLFLSRSWRDLVAQRGWFWATGLTMIAAAGVAALPLLTASEAGVGFTLESVGPLQYVASQPSVILHYLRLSLWPHPLLFDYGWAPESDPAWIFLSAAMLVAMVFKAVQSLRQGSLFGFWFLAAMVVLAPTSSVVPLQDLIVEHRMYVPLAFLLSGLVFALFRFSPQLFVKYSKFAPLAIVLSLAIAAGVMTSDRNTDYHSAITMWEDTIAKQERSPHAKMLAGRAYSNLGEAYGDAQRWEDSIQTLRQAAKFANSPELVQANLARAYLATGEIRQAALHASAALEENSDSARIRQQVGLIYAATGDFPAAESHFRAALEMDRGDPVIMLNLAQALVAQQKPNGEPAQAAARPDGQPVGTSYSETDKEAIDLLIRAIQIDPSQEVAHERLIALHLRNGDVSAAAKIVELLETRPLTAERLELFGDVAAHSGDIGEAVQLWEKSAASDQPPRHLCLRLGDLYRAKNDLRMAEKYYEREVNFFPQSVAALNNLAALTAPRNPQLAIRYFERLLEVEPSFLQAEYNIASLQFSLGELPAARARLEAILDRQPEFEPAKALLLQVQTNQSEKARQ